MSTHTYKFNVSMSCNGCSGAVDRVLKKLEGGLSLSSPLPPPPPLPLFSFLFIPYCPL